MAACFGAHAQANPTGPTVVNGAASFSQLGNVLKVTNTPNAIINWQSFSIGAGDITRFIQQSSTSAVLNRVTTQNPSSILGALQSNGRVFLINSNGITFGAGAQIDVAGLVASSLNLSNADFLSGRLNFTATPGAGSVVNQGSIAGNGGGVYLVGPAVTNSGVITSPKGEVVLAAGNTVELVNPGTPNLRVEITAPDNRAVNLGTISADAGRVGIYAGLINHSGTISADSAEVGAEGRIILKAAKKTTLEAGSVLSAQGANGANGGFIETSADKVVIDPAAKVTTASQGGTSGTWLIDPTDFTIAAAGGDMTGATLSASLEAGNVTILSTSGAIAGVGDVNVNDPVTWINPTTLTLSALRHVNVNQPISANGFSGGVTLITDNTGTRVGTVNFGASGSVAAPVTNIYYNPPSYTSPTSFAANVTGPVNQWWLVQDLAQLRSINATSATRSGLYFLMHDVDAVAGIAPIGDTSTGTQFRGIFDGNNHVITNLNINNTSGSPTGLFSATLNGTIKNIGIVGGTVSGLNNVGALIGDARGTQILNSFSTADVSGSGGNVGGLIGKASLGTFSGVSVNSVFASGAVSGFSNVGGLVGLLDQPSSFINAYARGTVTGTSNVGGLVGSYSTANSVIFNSYSSGRVSGSSSVGGLIGICSNPGFGAVCPSSVVQNSFWDTTASGQASSALNGTGSATLGIGMSTADMQTQANFTGPTAANGNNNFGARPWDFTNVWEMTQGAYPTLRNAKLPVAPPATFLWDNDSGDFLWSNPLNWNFNTRLPGSIDSVVLNLPSSTVNFSSGTTSIASITSSPNNHLFILGGGLTVLGAASFSGDVSVQAGTLALKGAAPAASTVNLSGTGVLDVTGAMNVATLNWTGVDNNNTLGQPPVGTTIKGNGTGLLTVLGALNMPAPTAAGGYWWNHRFLDGANLRTEGTGANATVLGSGTGGGNGATLTLLNGATLNNSGEFVLNYANIGSGAGTNAFNNLLTGVFSTPGPAGGGSMIVPFNNYGTVNVGAGGGGVTLASGGTSSGAFNIGSGSAVALTSGNTQTMSGTISGPGTMINDGTLNLAGATLSANGVLTNNGAVVVQSGANTISGAVSGPGTMAVSVGSLEVDGTASAASMTNAGTIRGTGTITVNSGTGTLTNTGHIAPGTASTPGTLSVNGNVAFGSASSFDVRLASPTSFDTLAVTGGATLAGTLNATQGSGYTPNGESLPVLTYASRTGAFATHNLPADFQQTYNAGNLTLTHSVASGDFWTNTAGDFLWTTAGNWSQNRIPNSTDDVTLNVSGGSEARVTSGTNTVKTLTSSANNSLLINGGSLTVLGAANLAGGATVQSGNLTLQGTSSVSNYTQSGGALALSSATLSLTGLSTWTAGTITGSGSSSLNVLSGASLTVSGASQTLSGLPLNNSGQLAVGSDLTLGAGAQLHNTGTVELQNGTLATSGNGLIDNDGGKIFGAGLLSGTHKHHNGATLGDALASVTLTLAGTGQFDGTNTINGNNAVFGVDPASGAAGQFTFGADSAVTGYLQGYGDSTTGVRPQLSFGSGTNTVSQGIVGQYGLTLTGGTLNVGGSGVLGPGAQLTLSSGTLSTPVLSLSSSDSFLKGGADVNVTKSFIHTAGELSTTGNVSITQAVGDLTLAQPLTAGSLQISAPLGSLTVGGALNSTGDTTLVAGGAITGAGLIAGNQVTLSGAMGIGVNPSSRVNTNARTLTANSTTSGGVFVNQTGAVTLGADNGAAAGNPYDLISDRAITVSNAVNTAGTGDTNLASRGSATDSVVLNAPVGNATGSAHLASFGDITGGGTVTGNSVTLEAKGAIGDKLPVNTSSTGLLSLTAKGVGSSGNINVAEANSLATDRLAIATDPSVQNVRLSGTALSITSDIFDPADSLDLAGRTTISAGTLSGTGTLINRVGGTLTLNSASSVAISRPVTNLGTLNQSLGANTIAGTVAGNGTLNVDGGALTFTAAYTGGTVNVGAGKVSFDTANIGGETNVSGGEARFSTVFTGGTMNLSGGTARFDFNPSNLKVSTAAALNLSGGAVEGSGGVIIGGDSTWTTGTIKADVQIVNGVLQKTGRGIVTLPSQGIKLFSGTTLRLSGGEIVGGVTNEGTVEIAGDLNAPNLALSNLASGKVAKTAGSGNATLGPIFDGGGHWQVQSGTLTLGGGGGDSGTSRNNKTQMTVDRGAGTLLFGGGTFYMGDLNVESGATAVISTATVSLDAYAFNNSNYGTVTVGNGGILRQALGANLVNFGTMIVEQGGSIALDGDLANRGILGGSGAILMSANVAPRPEIINDGIIAPGGVGKIGTLSITGDVTFRSGSSLALDMATNARYDKLVVSGAATLNGTLGLVKTNPAYLADGTTMTPLTYASRTGAFSTVSLPPQYSVVYLTDRMNVLTPNLAAPVNTGVQQAANQAAAGASTIVQLLGGMGGSNPGGGGTLGGSTIGGTASGGTANPPPPSCKPIKGKITVC